MLSFFVQKEKIEKYEDKLNMSKVTTSKKIQHWLQTGRVIIT